MKRSAMSAGRFSCRSRWLPGIALVLITVAMMFGVARLSFNDDYKSLFRTQAEDSETLDLFLEEFPADENELSLVFTADDVLARPVLGALQKIIDRLEERPEVETVFSIFSIPSKTLSTREIRQILPDQIATAPELQQAIKELVAHPLAGGHLISDDRRVTLAVIGLSRESAAGLPQIENLLSVIHGMVREEGGNSGLDVAITGNPAIRVSLRSQSLHDQVVFNSLGGVLASLVALLLFRSYLVTLVVSIGPLLGVLWTLGVMGFADTGINVINQMIPPLVMVIGFTDAVHLMFSVQRQRRDGTGRISASVGAVREVGLACALTSITTAIGFGSLLLSHSAVIRELGLYAAAGTLLTFVAVITFVPLVASLLPDRILLRAQGVDRNIQNSKAFRFLAGRLLHAPSASAAIGALLTIVTLGSAFFLTTDFRFRENLPAGHEVSRAYTIADNALGGVQPVNIVVGWPQSGEPSFMEILDVIGETQARVAASAISGHAVSILDILDLLPGKGPDLAARIPRLVYLPEALVDRFLNEEKRKAVILLRVPDSGARSQMPVLDKLASQLEELRHSYPGYEFALTGIAVTAIRGSTGMIGDMAVSLMSAVVIIFLMLAFVLGSVRLGIISFLPNILPLSGIAAVLVWSNQPLQYATIMVFTICLGITVDDTIHVLVRYRRESSINNSARVALQRTLYAVGPVLVTTTLILMAGFGAMITSATEVVVRMGLLSCLAFMTALFSDLVILPALVILLYGKRKTSKAASGDRL